MVINRGKVSESIETHKSYRRDILLDLTEMYLLTAGKFMVYMNQNKIITIILHYVYILIQMVMLLDTEVIYIFWSIIFVSDLGHCLSLCWLVFRLCAYATSW